MIIVICIVRRCGEYLWRCHMKNRWEVTVEQSNYDFNPFIESDHGTSFRTVGNVYQDWQDEIKIANANQYDFKWVYDGKIFNGNSGELWYFNANKRHSVFSTKDGIMLLVVCLSFDKELFLKLTRSSLVK